MTTRRRLGGLGVLALLLGAGAVSEAAAGGGCIAAVVTAPIILPDGSLHPSGLIRLCDSHTISPVARLHAAAINGRAVGMLRSRAFRSEAGENDRPVIFFRTERRGRLRLIGYSVPGRDGALTFDLMAAQRRSGPTADEPGPVTLH